MAAKMYIKKNNTTEDVSEELMKMRKKADKEAVSYLEKIGIAIKSAVAMMAPVSNNRYYWSKGKKKENTHIADDVVSKVKKSRKAGRYVTISGGKKTWPKWIVASDGHVAPNGVFIRGNNFVEKAVSKTESEVNDIIDQYLEGVVSSD